MLTDQRIIYLNPRDLLPSRENVRSDPGDLAGLAETIREHGILQPIGVAPEDGTYRVVYGNRRRDAAIVVGLDRVPCVTIQVGDQEDIVVQQVLENLQRLDLNDMDKAQAFDRMLEHLIRQGSSQSEALDKMARTLGLSARQIQRYLRLLQLAPQVRQMVNNGDMGVTHAQHLVDIAPDVRQEEIAVLVVEESLSAAELSRLVATLRHNANIDPLTALEFLRRGERVPVIESRPREEVSRLTPEPMPRETAAEAWDEGDDGNETSPAPWEDDDRAFGDAPQREEEAFAHLESTTRDGNRVRKIHSLDSFVDEIQRLTRCVQDGDLQRLIESDGAAELKVGLAARQLRFLSKALSALAQTEDAR